jgi:uncharacterized cupin superfamily protein
MAEEARLVETPSGLAPETDGWFVVNVRHAAWRTHGAFGDSCIFEGAEARFPELGINIRVLRPGQPAAMYHAESAQEDFLVLAGECLLLVEGEERPLRAWDLVHCPPNTEHVLVGAGDGPCVVLMTGARGSDWSVVYPASEVARRHGAGVERETPPGRRRTPATNGRRLGGPGTGTACPGRSGRDGCSLVRRRRAREAWGGTRQEVGCGR